MLTKEDVGKRIAELEQQKELFRQQATAEVSRRLGEFDGQIAAWREVLGNLEEEKAGSSDVDPSSPVKAK